MPRSILITAVQNGRYEWRVYFTNDMRGSHGFARTWQEAMDCIKRVAGEA